MGVIQLIVVCAYLQGRYFLAKGGPETFRKGSQTMAY